MLNQSINLYQDRFKEKKVPLSAAQMLTISVVTLMLLVVAGFWVHDRHSQLALENEQLLAQKTASTQRLAQIKQQLEELLANNEIDQQLNRVTQDIAVRKQMIDFVANNQFGSGEGFSDNLVGLSEVNVKEVWLDEIALAENYVKLSGSALKAEKVPEYFNAFRDKRLFNGRVFDIFELSREQQRDWKVDFVIASKAPVNE